MNPLVSRKKLLLAESELNRVGLVQEWQAMADEAHALVSEARTLRSFASATASLVTGLVSFWRKRPAPADAKPSPLKTILKVAVQVSTLWSAFRSRVRD